jgi:tetratricopeptide (TPR) repeat protein
LRGCLKLLTILCVALGASVNAAWADSFGTNRDRCASHDTDPDLRIGACTWLLNSGQLDDASIPNVFRNRGPAYSLKGDLDRAIENFSEAVKLDPRHPANYATRGFAYLRKHQYERAIEDFDRASDRGPNPLVYQQRGLAYQNLRQHDRALDDYTRSIALDPKREITYRYRAIVYGRIGKIELAINDYRQAVKLAPQSPRSLNGLAWLLATAKDERLRNGAEAVDLATQAVGLSASAQNRDTLAAAYAAAGRFDDAVAEQGRAIELLRKEGQEKSVADFEERLALYREGKPYYR